MELKKYNAFDIAEAISNNTDKAIESAKPWYLRRFNKMFIIVSMVLLDAITTFVSIHAKLSTRPFFTFMLTVFVSLILNVPQEIAIRNYRKFRSEGEKMQLVAFVISEVCFIATEVFISLVKIDVAPDLISSSNGLFEASGSDSDRLLTVGLAGLLIASSVFSSVVCFSLGIIDDDRKRNSEVQRKTLNSNYPLSIMTAGAEEEYKLIDADKLNLTDDLNRAAAHMKVMANTVKNKCLFRDALMRKLTPDGVNEASDGAQKIVEAFESEGE